MPLQEFVVHFETGKNLWLTFKMLFFVFGSSIGDNGFENTFKTLLTDANKLFLQAKGH